MHFAMAVALNYLHLHGLSGNELKIKNTMKNDFIIISISFFYLSNEASLAIYSSIDRRQDGEQR